MDDLKITGRRVDAHVHTSGVSSCSKVSPEQAIENKIAEGYRGMIMVNHCQPWYYDPPEHKDYCRRAVEEWKRGREYAQSRDFLALLGIEISINNPYNDYLVYGIDQTFFENSPCFYTLSQKELFDYCVERKAILVQAHPFRNSGPAIPEYLHGTEINCTPGDDKLVEEVKSLAEANGLMLFAGNDYHGDRRATLGGIILPETVKDEKSFNEYLFSTDHTDVFVGDSVFSFSVGDRDKKIKK